LLVLAPRRPERFDEVAAFLGQEEVRVVRRSKLDAAATLQALEPASPPTPTVLVLDTVGELLDFMPVARAVFVGGTMTASVGGHNVLEPAVFGKPVAFGPHTDNVAGAAAALLAAGAALLVHNPSELGDEWNRLLADPGAAEAMGAQGRAVVAAQADVAQRTAEVVCQMIDGSDV
jgi:3-deoxy-D-manno-octulosonic-acid transferase